jgi:hypothetical protein
MKRPTEPPLPPPVEARMAKHQVIDFEIREGEACHERFLRVVRAGDIPNIDDIRMVARRLENVLAGMSFRKAFCMQPGQGRKADKKINHRNQLIRAEVQELRLAGYVLDDAADLVSRRYSVSPETVSKLHKDENRRQRQHLEYLAKLESKVSN